MKILALNSSPRRGQGGTALLLDAFLEGMRQAGADVELVYLHGLEIKPCLGCFHCWTKTPGRCVQDDDMATLLPDHQWADVVVYATPLYVDGMNGTMKTFLDRSIPLMEPFFELRDGHCRHPRRGGPENGKVVLVSVCGFTELENFDPLVAHVKAVCLNLGREYSGALLRPYGASLPALEKHGIPVADVLSAAEEAGRQLAEQGHMDEETLRRVSAELVPRQQYVAVVNTSFRRMLDKPAPSGRQ